MSNTTNTTIKMFNRDGYEARVTQLPTGTYALLTPCCHMLAMKQEGRMENFAVCACGGVYGINMIDRFTSLADLRGAGWSVNAPVFKPAKVKEPVAQSDDEWDEFM